MPVFVCRSNIFIGFIMQSTYGIFQTLNCIYRCTKGEFIGFKEQNLQQDNRKFHFPSPGVWLASATLSQTAAQSCRIGFTVIFLRGRNIRLIFFRPVVYQREIIGAGFIPSPTSLRVRLVRSRTRISSPARGPRAPSGLTPVGRPRPSSDGRIGIIITYHSAHLMCLEAATEALQHMRLKSKAKLILVVSSPDWFLMPCERHQFRI